MIYDLLISLIKKQVYIVFQETYQNSSNSHYIDRYAGKHPLLKPELMVVDDELYGFKHMSKHVVGLESFPIYIEIEYSKGSDDDKIIDSIEIYSGTTLKSDAYIDDILSLNQVYRKTILVDRIQRLNEANMSFLFIYSRLSELFEDGELNQDILEGLLTEKELKVMFDIQLTSFLNFIKMTDDIMTKGSSVNRQNSCVEQGAEPLQNPSEGLT